MAYTYYRHVIGVDSDGWIYTGQKKVTNNVADVNTKIERTKDFVTFEDFALNTGGIQLIELENGELCFAGYTWESDQVYCNIYVTSNGKSTINKKFSTTVIAPTNVGYLWSWGLSSRGSKVAVAEYGTQGQCGGVWYSRDFGQTFNKVFWFPSLAPDPPNAHVHGCVIDPYWNRIYVITGDGSPFSNVDLYRHNSKLYYWDDDGRELSASSWDEITWEYLSIGLSDDAQMVNGYALESGTLFGSDSSNNGIFRIPRTSKDLLTFEKIIDLGVSEYSTKYCGGNFFKRDDYSPLFITVTREFSNDLEPDDANNPSGLPNTYKSVPAKIFMTYDGITLYQIWEDNTYGSYPVIVEGVEEVRNLAKCNRDMTLYHLANGDFLLKYTGQPYGSVGYNNNGTTGLVRGYSRFVNEVVKMKLIT